MQEMLAWHGCEKYPCNVAVELAAIDSKLTVFRAAGAKAVGDDLRQPGVGLGEARRPFC